MVKKMQAEMKHLSVNVEDRDRTIKAPKKKMRKDMQVRMLSKGFGLCADMFDSANRLNDFVVNGLSPGTTPIEVDANWALQCQQ